MYLMAMWKKYINIFEKSPVLMDEYFIYIQSEFSDLFKALSKDQIVERIHKPNDDLFYQIKNINNFFYNGGVEEVIAIFRYYFEIDWSFLSFKPSLVSNNLNQSYKNELLYLQKSNFANSFSLDIEKLLSVGDVRNQFIYLFIFFMPCINKKQLLFNVKKDIPLISCQKIDIENFHMLQDLMKLYEIESYQNCCKNYNFNHMLITDYMKNFKTTTKNSLQWEKELPIEKMTILLKEGCTFTDFALLRNNNKFIRYPKLNSVLIEFQSLFISNRLEASLLLKTQENKKLVKI